MHLVDRVMPRHRKRQMPLGRDVTPAATWAGSLVNNHVLRMPNHPQPIAYTDRITNGMVITNGDSWAWS